MTLPSTEPQGLQQDEVGVVGLQSALASFNYEVFFVFLFLNSRNTTTQPDVNSIIKHIRL